MRTLSLVALCAAPLFSLAQTEKPNFTVSGSFKNIAAVPEMVYLNYASNGQRINDSAEVKNGTYTFSGTVTEPVQASLRAKGAAMSRKNLVTLFLDKGKIKLVSTDSFTNAKITGSKAHAAYETLNKQLKPYNDQMNALEQEFYKLQAARDEAGVAKIREKAGELGDEMSKIYKNYAIKNPKSPLALYAINQFSGGNMDADEVEPIFNALPAATKETKSGKDLAAKLDIAKKTGIGRPAMEFTQNDTLGNPVSLSSFKGKYVLIDFWASWCGPCRAENPNVVKAFENFKDKGFTVLGISLDQPGKKDKWLEAIHADNLTWTHVSDLQFWNNAVARQYGINSIPQNLLVDPNGIIVAKNIRGEELQKKLAEIIK